MAEQTITISGAPVLANLNGTFYLSDPTQTGKNRVWRNRGPSVIYFQEQNDDNPVAGWRLADVITGTVYFSGPVRDNPWDIQRTDWVSDSYHNYINTLTLINDTESTRTTILRTPEDPTKVTSDPVYDPPKESTFYATKDYYYHKSTWSLEKFYLVRKIVAGNKVDPCTFYDDDSGNSFTTDAYFLSTKNYYTKQGSDKIPAVFIESEIPTYIDNGVTKCDFYCHVGDVTTVTTSEIDNLTGSVVTESTNTITNLKDIEIEVHKRYCAPNLEVGKVYRFAFVNDFRYLGYMPPTAQDFEIISGVYGENQKKENDSDITRGIYRVENITTYYSLVLSGVDVYQNLYLPLNLSKELYEADRKKWMNDDIWYKLVDPTLPTRVFYVPVGIIDGIPDGSVTEYDRYHLIVDIGIFSDPAFLAELVTDVNMLLRGKFGIPSSTQLASYDKIYIPNDYYEWLEKARKQYSEKFLKQNESQYFQTFLNNEQNGLYQNNLELIKKVEAYESLLSEVNNG